ncbi:MAG: hypothetical protein K8S98_07900 [Planctomycetes bacterium]|nr:hypothetical protein [Planctomycetota bacterium]
MRLGRTTQAIVDATNAWFSGALAEFTTPQRAGSVAWIIGVGAMGVTWFLAITRPPAPFVLASLLLCAAIGVVTARRPHLGCLAPIAIGIGSSVVFLATLHDGRWPVGVVVLWELLFPSLVCAAVVSARVRRRR